MIKFLLFVSFIVSDFNILAQANLSVKIPPVQPSDFKLFSQKSDTANAVVLLDSSSCVLTADPQRGFYTSYHHFRRILILRKEALDPGEYDAGTQTIYYNKEYNGDQKLKSLRVCTYNLINGHVENSVLPDKDMYITTDKKKDNYIELKFAYANAKVGSILEMEYTKDNYSTEVLDWYFQEVYPVIKKLYTAVIPNIWEFVVVKQNEKYITGVQQDSVVKNIYSYNWEYEHVTFHSTTWSVENVPAMRNEPFTSTIYNYTGFVKFLLSVRPVRPDYSEPVFIGWNAFNSLLVAALKSDIDPKDQSWAKKVLKEKLGEHDNNLVFARQIFAMVRDHYINTGRGLVSSHYLLKETYESGRGGVTDINLTLILMLRSQNFKADPVVLSTRDNGFTSLAYPNGNYNYTICRLETDGRIFYLDASDRKIGFGKLPKDCYNGYARVIVKNGYTVNLSADSIRESSQAFATVEYDSVTSDLILNCSVTMGYYESLDVRHELDKEILAKYVKSIAGTKTPEGTLDSLAFSDLDSLDRPIRFFYRMRLGLLNSTVFYFNPLVKNGLLENPFKSAVRNYPVELPYSFDKTIVLNMNIPDGYEVDEMPKSERATLNVGEGSFDYIIQKNPNSIQLKYVLNIKKANFDPEDYKTLRDFYAEVIKKQAEVVILKKR